ncbi:hypothetical protein FRACA_190042 [Frankia canadensis]|uniref:Uncharacterized protein n=1 Tax=Frankia canadensis TaxID=1836972 RepID=A0A2I2KP90_9ACTN|nr:hypothetical protein FRACA_190042 [Frankia canadensis]SOU54752.1 hypothetical protein FRACA_190042 [Frankia canadensis]
MVLLSVGRRDRWTVRLDRSTDTDRYHRSPSVGWIGIGIGIGGRGGRRWLAAKPNARPGRRHRGGHGSPA